MQFTKESPLHRLFWFAGTLADEFIVFTTSRSVEPKFKVVFHQFSSR